MPDRTTPEDAARRPRWVRYALPLLPIVLMCLAFATERMLRADQVLRNVVVLDVALGGASPDGARGAIAALEVELSAAPLTIRLRDDAYELVPTDVGFSLDVEGMLNAALAAGRDGGVLSQLGWWIGRFGSPHPLAVMGRVDEAKLDARLAEWERASIADAPFEGAIEIEDGKAVARPPRSGFAIDRAAAREALVASMTQRVREPVALPLLSRAPTRTLAMVEEALVQAKDLLSAPIILKAELPPDDPALDEARENKKLKDDEESDDRIGHFELSREAVAAALQSRLAPMGLEVALDPRALEPALVELRKRLERPPVDARFEVSKRDEVSVVDGRPARVVDAEKVAAALQQAARSPDRTAVLPIDVGAPPSFSRSDAEALRIAGLVSKFTTSFPCCRPRVKNIYRMAELIDGVILEPGERFSINEHVGERTERNGFFPAPTIVHGEMEDTIGGGVSQFATTFFNAAFYGAYEIIERQPHSYYFDRYPMGHEATLSFPKPDVIIRNDTEAGLFIRAIATPTTITVKFYGDNGGRKVKRKKSAVFDITDPPIEYIADDELDPEKEKVKERGKVGWSLNVARVIIHPDGTQKEESRKVTYMPQVRRVRVHSCKIPKGEDGHTGKACPEPEPDEEEETELAVDDIERADVDEGS